MPAPALWISYGNDEVLFERADLTTRRDGLDQLDYEALSSNRNTFNPEASVTGYGGLYVERNTSVQQGPWWSHRGTAVGLYGATSRIIDSTADSVEDGFDVGTETHIIHASNSLSYGRAHSQHPNLRAISIGEAVVIDQLWKRVTLQFKGIKLGGKPIRRKVSTITKDASRESFRVTIPGGDGNNQHNWNLLLTEPSLQLSYLSLTRPNSSAVGQQGSGNGIADFPDSYDLGLSDSDTTLKWQWPNGVVLAAIDWEEIPGTTICFVTEYYVKRQKVTLG